MQTREGTVTFKCEGCGVRKPEAERYRPQSSFTVCSQVCLVERFVNSYEVMVASLSMTF